MEGREREREKRDKPFTGLHYLTFCLGAVWHLSRTHHRLPSVPRRVLANKIHAVRSALLVSTYRLPSCLSPPAGSLAPIYAGSARRMVNPDPSKIGEFLRSASALGEHLPDHLASQGAGHATVGDQSGWCLRGQCHWRGTTESLIHSGVLEPVVAGDLDLVNLFGSAQWPFVWRARRLFSPSSERMSPSSFLTGTSWTRSTATFALVVSASLLGFADHCWRLTIHQGDVMWHGAVALLSPCLHFCRQRHKLVVEEFCASTGGSRANRPGRLRRGRPAEPFLLHVYGRGGASCPKMATATRSTPPTPCGPVENGISRGPADAPG